MRTVLAIRHAHSTANEATAPLAMSEEELAFANRSAKLSPEGMEQCPVLAETLYSEYGIDPIGTLVAISQYVRTQQTAELVGFRQEEGWTTPYEVLNEVDHKMDIDNVLRPMIRRNQIPPIALQAAEETLDQPPPESVWITHGLLIAGLCTRLGIAHLYEHIVPRQCEVRELTLPF